MLQALKQKITDSAKGKRQVIDEQNCKDVPIHYHLVDKAEESNTMLDAKYDERLPPKPCSRV